MIIKQNDFNRWPRKCGAFSCFKVSIQLQGADFISIEPWCGIPDSLIVNSNGIKRS
jgi:hypothetical protein